jgi:hypothetical protein
MNLLFTKGIQLQLAEKRRRITNMFEQFSVRAKRVIFLARVGAGGRGALMIEVDDLLAALQLEDQNKTSEALGETGEAGTVVCLKPHQPFLPTDLATGLLEELQALPRSQAGCRFDGDVDLR